MFNLINKIVALLEGIIVFLVPISQPIVSPTPTAIVMESPVLGVETTASPTSTPITTASPTPSSTPDVQQLIAKVEELKQELKNYTPEPTPTPQISKGDFCRNLPYDQTVLPLGMYRTQDGDCFIMPSETPVAKTPTPTPTPTFTPILTLTPTPEPTPIPEPKLECMKSGYTISCVNNFSIPLYLKSIDISVSNSHFPSQILLMDSLGNRILDETIPANTNNLKRTIPLNIFVDKKQNSTVIHQKGDTNWTNFQLLDYTYSTH